MQCCRGLKLAWFTWAKLFSTQSFSKVLFTWGPLPFRFSRRGTMLDTRLSLLLVVLVFATSIIFFAIVSESWLDLKSFQPTWIITRLNDWLFEWLLKWSLITKLNSKEIRFNACSKLQVCLITWMMECNFFSLDSKFKQQKLPAWQPILTASTVLPIFFAIGIVFLSIGIALLVTSNKVSKFSLD